MKYLKFVLLLAGTVFPQYTFSEAMDKANARNISDCQKGGVYLNNSVELAMCWGDHEIITDFNMTRQGFVRVFNFPNSPDAYFYQGGLVFGSEVEVVRLLFSHGELIEIYSVFQNITENPSYNGLNQTYEEFRDYFTDPENLYKKILDTPRNKVFEGSYSGCEGDCGPSTYENTTVDIELKLFIEGRAKQTAIFKDNLSVAGIRIEVPKWNLVYNGGVDIFSMKIPYFTLCFSEPTGSNARITGKIKRRK